MKNLKLFFILIILTFFLPINALAVNDDNIKGWAWSENIGWISFNCYNDYNDDGTPESHCTDTGYGSDYGVDIDSSTGNFSGYAWAGGGEDADGTQRETIGWISFDRTETYTPPGSPYVSESFIAKVDDIDSSICDSDGNTYLDDACGGDNTSNTPIGDYKQVFGWARTLTACQDDLWDGAKCIGSGAGDSAGGWDGWIKLSRDSGDGGENFGVTININTGAFGGWAWSAGSLGIGWISFSGSNYKTLLDDLSIFNSPPYIKPGSQIIEGQDYCILGEGKGQVSFKWTYKDDDGDNQSQFDFRVNDVNNVNDLNPEIDRSVIGLSNPDGTDNTQTVEVVSPIQSDKITYNTTYYWWAKVYDNNGGDSGWVSVPSFTTASDISPSVDFSWSPLSPASEETIQFTDQTVFYGTNPSWAWDFDEDSITDSTEQNPTYSYSTSGDHTVDLTATDSKGSCSVQETLSAALPLPEWKEVAPFGLFNKFLAIISKSFNSLIR